MCGLSSDASLPAARCACGSVFILLRKRCTGGKMESGGLWREASLPATLGVVVKHGRHCMQVVATLAPKGYRFSKTENRPQNGNDTTHVMCDLSLALCLPPTYFLFRGDRFMCTRIVFALGVLLGDTDEWRRLNKVQILFLRHDSCTGH